MSQFIMMPEDSTLRTVFIPQIVLDSMDTAANNAVFFAPANGGANVTLDKTEAQKLQVGKTFASVRQITDSCFAIRNTLFNEITPKPTWYDELNGKFGEVKKYANQWIDTHSVAVTSTIPSSVMTFAPTFTNSANAINGILTQGTGGLTSAELHTIRDVYARLLDKISAISRNVNTYARLENGVAVGKLIDWQTNMGAAGLALKTGNVSIQKASADLTDQIKEFEGEIETLKKDIAYYNKLIATGAGLVGGGVFIGVIGIGLCAVFPVIGGIVLAVGIASVVGGATLWGVYQGKINAANKSIREYDRKIDANKKTITSLGVLSTSMDLAVSNAELATQNMVDFAASWVTFGNSLKNTIQAIDNGKIEETRLGIQLELDDAKSFWGDVKDYAQKLLDVPTGVKKVPADQVA